MEHGAARRLDNFLVSFYTAERAFERMDDIF